MSDYIRREAAIVRATKGLADDFDAYNVKVNLEAIPAADVVEVVRCRECEYRDSDDEYRDSEGELYGKNVAVCTGAMAYFNTPDDWYCAMGKRKDRWQEDG